VKIARVIKEIENEKKGGQFGKKKVWCRRIRFPEEPNFKKTNTRKPQKQGEETCMLARN